MWLCSDQFALLLIDNAWLISLFLKNLFVEIICRSETCWCNLIPGSFGRVKEIILSPTHASHVFTEASNCLNALCEEEGGKTWSTFWQSSVKRKENGQNVDADVCDAERGGGRTGLNISYTKGGRGLDEPTLIRDVLILKVKKNEIKKTYPLEGLHVIMNYHSTAAVACLRMFSVSGIQSAAPQVAAARFKLAIWDGAAVDIKKNAPGTGLSARRGSPEVCDRKKRMMVMVMMMSGETLELRGRP